MLLSQKTPLKYLIRLNHFLQFRVYKHLSCLGRSIGNLNRNSEEQDCIDLLQMPHSQEERRASIESCV